jgi:hypothetical protein
VDCISGYTIIQGENPDCDCDRPPIGQSGTNGWYWVGEDNCDCCQPCCNLEGLTVNFMGTSKTITEEDIVGGKVIITTGATSEDYCVDEDCTAEIPGDYQDQYLELSCNSDYISVFASSCCYRVFSDPQISSSDYCKEWTGKIYFDANCNPEQLTEIECVTNVPSVECEDPTPASSCEPTDPLGSLSVSKSELP